MNWEQMTEGGEDKMTGHEVVKALRARILKGCSIMGACVDINLTKNNCTVAEESVSYLLNFHLMRSHDLRVCK